MYICIYSQNKWGVTPKIYPSMDPHPWGLRMIRVHFIACLIFSLIQFETQRYRCYFGSRPLTTDGADNRKVISRTVSTYGRSNVLASLLSHPD